MASTAVGEVSDGLVLRSTPGRLALAATVGASSMAFLDSTIVNVALPHIGKDFDASVSQLQWVLTGYLLSLASLILLGGALGDRYGRRRMFTVGVVWFAGASLLCGAAPNVEVLIAARILQGIGGALLTPGSLAIIQASFQEKDRAPAVGLWSGFGGIAGAIGPFLGGWLVDGPGWRWAFLLNVPLGLAVIVCTKAAVPETRDEHSKHSLDYVGAGLGVIGLASMTYALTEAGPNGWSDPAVIAGALVAAVAMFMFVWRMLHTDEPLVPPRLFKNRNFTVMNGATFLLYGSLGVVFFVVSYELQVATGWSALRAGTALLPTTAVMLVGSARSGALAARIGPRLQLTVGPLLAAAGLLLLTRIGPETSWLTDVLPGSLLFGLGLVTFVAPLTATVMSSADPDHVSVASGVNNAIARTASLTALAVIPSIAGLATASGAAEVTDAFRLSLVIAAAIAAIASPLCFIGLSAHTHARRTLRRYNYPVDGTPLQPDPQRCPELIPSR